MTIRWIISTTSTDFWHQTRNEKKALGMDSMALSSVEKSHSAVGAISMVSICGMAIATAAIICVLSVFNGFKDVIAGRLDSLSPDIMVTPAKGKVFENADSIAEAIAATEGIRIATPTLTDNALAICGSKEMPVTLKGVDMARYRKTTSLDSLVIDRYSPSGPGEKQLRKAISQ